MTDPTPKPMLASLLAALPPEADGLPPEVAAIDPAAPPQWAWSAPDADGYRTFRCPCGMTVWWGPRDGLTPAQAEAAHWFDCGVRP